MIFDTCVSATYGYSTKGVENKGESVGYQQGEIYFIRELDRATKGHTPFVKIGLVRDAEDRDSFNRLVEHQTGNPRTLDLDRSGIVQTPAVDLVEAQLHRYFAPRRVSGEWFEFESEAQIQEAIKTATAFAKDAAARVPVFEIAEHLKMVTSEGSREPDATDLEIAREIAGAKLQIAACEELQDRIQEILKASIEAGANVESVATTSLRTFKPKLQQADLREAHPELFEKYIVKVPSWQQRFLPKLKLADDDVFDETFNDSVQGVADQLSRISDHTEAGKLNEPSLALRTLLGLANWTHEYAVARLKQRIGTLEEITGVCTWKRYEKIDLKFDEYTFATENPDLAQKFTSEGSTKTYVKPKGTKSS